MLRARTTRAAKSAQWAVARSFASAADGGRSPIAVSYPGEFPVAKQPNEGPRFLVSPGQGESGPSRIMQPGEG